MPKYTVKQGEDLGLIAEKYCLPSWKYLYELNKEAIGDNPDLLQPGTKLSIPAWDATSGDEKIEAKGAKAFAYTGGLGYRYPWVPFSLSLVGEDGKTVLEQLDEPAPFVVRLRDTNQIVSEGEITNPDQLGILLPHAQVKVGIKGTPLHINGEAHLHPDDEINEES